MKLKKKTFLITLITNIDVFSIVNNKMSKHKRYERYGNFKRDFRSNWTLSTLIADIQILLRFQS